MALTSQGKLTVAFSFRYLPIKECYWQQKNN